MSVSTALAALICVTADLQPARAQSVTASGEVNLAIPPGSPTPPLVRNGLLYVGFNGLGQLSIEDGGKVSNVDGSIAYAVGSVGTVTVTGPGSTWTNSGKLRVGNAGNGTLIIKDGGKVSNLNGSIGTGSGHSSTATVSGDGSTWTNSGNLTVGYYGTGTLTIDDGGKVSADHVVLGRNSGSGTLNLNGSTGSGRGVLETAYVANSGDGTVALNFDGGILRATENQASYLQNFGDITLGAGGLWFDTNSFEISIDADTTFSGTSSINKIGPGTLSLTGDNSGFTGATTVSGGTLLVGDASGSGTLGGTVTVENGATVGGSGTVGAVDLASGATIAPGNSIGTLNVAGDITFSSGSTYEVEVDPTGAGSDSIHATGIAHLNSADVAHVGLDGRYDPFSNYTILTADGGIDGTFGDVTSVYAFLTPELSYGANMVALELTRNDIDFVDKARTRNQKATAEGAESLGQGNEVYNAIAALPNNDAQIRDSFDQLSGEIHASAKTALIEDSRFVRDAVSDRIRAAFGDMPETGTPVLAYGSDGPRPPAAADSDGDGPVAWGNAYGGWGETDSDGNAAKLDRSTGGFLTGIDGAVTPNIRLGLLAGYGHSSFDVDDRASSGSSDNYHLGLYGGGQWDAVRLSGGLAYTWHDIETDRSVAFGGFSDRLSADYDAGTFQAFGEAGYRIDTAVASFEPFVGLAHVSLHTDGFDEDGGAAALSADSQTTSTTFTTLGVHASTQVDLGGTSATAHGSLGWRHAFGDTSPLSTQAFAGGDAFTVAGVPIAEDAAILEAGIDFDITDNATLGVSYSGQIASDAQEHGGRARLGVRF